MKAPQKISPGISIAFSNLPEFYLDFKSFEKVAKKVAYLFIIVLCLSV